MHLQNQLWVVTGAAGSVGSETARQLAQAGARVVLLDLNEDAVQAQAQTLPKVDTGSHIALACDITNEQQVTETGTKIREQAGTVNGLVNNAGITHFSAFESTRISVLQKVMDVNFWGAVYLTQALLPDLIANHGSIIALSSVAGFAPLADRTGYAASKHAMNGFFGSLRSELAEHNVHVCLVCPSYIDASAKAAATLGSSTNAATDTGVARPGTDHGRQVGKPLQPAEVAKAILQAIQQRKNHVNLGFPSHVAWILSRALPGLYQRVMLKSARGTN